MWRNEEHKGSFTRGGRGKCFGRCCCCTLVIALLIGEPGFQREEAISEAHFQCACLPTVVGVIAGFLCKPHQRRLPSRRLKRIFDFDFDLRPQYGLE